MTKDKESKTGASIFRPGGARRLLERGGRWCGPRFSARRRRRLAQLKSDHAFRASGVGGRLRRHGPHACQPSAIATRACRHAVPIRCTIRPASRLVAERIGARGRADAQVT